MEVKYKPACLQDLHQQLHKKETKQRQRGYMDVFECNGGASIQNSHFNTSHALLRKQEIHLQTLTQTIEKES